MGERDEKTGADLLRDAATKMRAKAERAATFRDATTGESLAWSASPHGDVHGLGGDWICDTASARLAEHVASWHPAAALAVADWLDAEAARVEHGRYSITHDGAPLFPADEQALAVARAYLAAPVSEGI